MAWNDLASNQTVSFTNLKDAVDTGVILGKTTITPSLEQVTKADVETYTWANTVYSPFSAKSSNQLVIKSDVIKGCWCWIVQNDDSQTRNATFTPCGTSTPVTVPVFGNGDFIRVCSNVIPTIDTFFSIITLCGSGGNALKCDEENDCTGCTDCGSPCGEEPYGQ